ncbi:hypothetical protein PMAYCL1PPCAC_12114, partial [Pristionchus mayeri]
SMLLRTIGGLFRSGLSSGGRAVRAFSAQTVDDEEKKKEVSPKEVLGEDMLKAVEAAANELGGDKEEKKGRTSSLLSRLVSHEKETYQSATFDQTSEMLSDPGVKALLEEVKVAPKALPNAIHERKMKKGAVLIRKEVFYEAVQRGYSKEDAQRIANKAVEEAEERMEEKRSGEMEKRETEKTEQGEEVLQREEREQQLFDKADDLAEKMLSGERGAEGKLAALATKVLEADPSTPSFLKSKSSLNIFSKADRSSLQIRRIGFWEEWEERAAKTFNQGLGPENAFEEQIVWTKKGAQWPYPINNEYMLGEEEKVPFFEHIFVDRRLADSNLPKEGPIAHFMHLVAVGLSKNPHMTVEKKERHIEWFISFFNEEKQKLVHKLHEQEQAAAAAAS